MCRWRALLQAFDFKIKHIPGRENRVADWLSRPPTIDTHNLTPSLSAVTHDPSLTASERTLGSMLQEVHGGRHLHYGVSRTWELAKQHFPGAKISIKAVSDYVRECPMCQKTRQTGISGLPSQTLSLKPSSYRRTVGVDHVTVTPADKNGYECVILVVEHFSHFPVAYPAKD